MNANDAGLYITYMERKVERMHPGGSAAHEKSPLRGRGFVISVFSLPVYRYPVGRAYIPTFSGSAEMPRKDGLPGASVAAAVFGSGATLAVSSPALVPPPGTVVDGIAGMGAIPGVAGFGAGVVDLVGVGLCACEVALFGEPVSWSTGPRLITSGRVNP
jgi:hypothetical protein